MYEYPILKAVLAYKINYLTVVIFSSKCSVSVLKFFLIYIISESGKQDINE